jgi:hypothetical protein
MELHSVPEAKPELISARALRKELQKVPQLHALLEKFTETAAPQPISYEI